LTLSRAALDALLRHAREAAPRECCGMLVGCADRVLFTVAATNLAESPTRYLIDPADHIRARREARQRELDVVGFYHSHPQGPAYPSALDIAEASYAECVWLIAGLGGESPEVRLFRISGAVVTDVPYTID
jgi:proteasome lid subunit RPN8/RPN11